MSLLVERHPHFIIATINAPARLNVLSSDVYERVGELLSEIGDNLDIRCLVITGVGRAFCAGADLKERGCRWRYVRRLNQVLVQLDSAPVPVIAAVNGLACGGGVELVTASDRRRGAEIGPCR